MTEAGVSRTARVAGWLGIAGPGLALVGIVINHLGAPPMAGFSLLQLGLLAALGGLVAGGIGLFLTRNGVEGRANAFTGIVLGVALLAAVVLGARDGAGVPPINDITTDLENPPAFAAAAPGHPNAGRDMSYPEEFVAQVRAAYADLVPLRVARPRNAAYELALAKARELGWEITREDPANATFEAEDVTAVWQFVDDVAVRVTGDGEHSVIDVRSKSRDGRGDLGANANRIRRLTAALDDPAAREGAAD